MTLVMGILNLTPDSFSDGGQYQDPYTAVSHARRMLTEGARIVDVGGESTRPGAGRVAAGEEMRRVIPVIRALASEGIEISVDTMRASVAEEAVKAGARIVNDVSGGQADPGMFDVVARSGVDYVIMHWRAHSARMQDQATYGDVVAEVAQELARQRDLAVAAGIAPERIILDPGLGFAKTWEHNWSVLRHLDQISDLGHRILLGASRKAFLGGLLGHREPQGRDAATAAVSFWAALHEVWAVRTHEIQAQVDAVAVAHRLFPSHPRRGASDQPG